MKDLKEKLARFARERQWEQFHSPKNLSMALSVEASEIVELLQWMTEEESRNLPPEKLEKLRLEIADVLIFLVRLADTCNIDPVKAAHEKIELNEKRYPAHLARGRSDKYTAYEE